MTQISHIYRIDYADVITDIVDPEQWRSFAESNAWVGSPHPADVVGHKIWEFIQNRETRHLYQQIFRRIRAGLPSHILPFRCDSPEERRYLELRTKALPNAGIEITSTFLRRELRDPVPLLDVSLPRSSEFVTICSMCKKIRIRPETWVEIEEGLIHFKLFEEERMPGLSHGLCEACYGATMRELEALDPLCPCH